MDFLQFHFHERLRFFQTHKFEQLHQLQVQTFEKTIRDCQIENDRKIDEYEILIKQISLRFI